MRPIAGQTHLNSCNSLQVNMHFELAPPALRLSMRVAPILTPAKNSLLLGFCGGI
jgi:hypothetical protein